MGERKGQNKYYPPDFDYKVHKSLSGYHGQHPLRERARKLDKGILIIRFEMPYNIWCDGCNSHIGMGVRYNAEKSKIGMYYTTPIYMFRMKCHLCPMHFEIKTDPSNHDYVIIVGARRKEQRWDPTENGQIVPEDRDSQKKLALDSMYKIEHGVVDKTKLDALNASTMIALVDNRSSHKDDFLLNQLARKKLRETKKVDSKNAVFDNAIKKRLSLSLNLLPEKEKDIKAAKLMKMSTIKTYEEKSEENRKRLLSGVLIASNNMADVSSQTPVSSTSSSLESLSSARQNSVRTIQQIASFSVNKIRSGAFDLKEDSIIPKNIGNDTGRYKTGISADKLLTSPNNLCNNSCITLKNEKTIDLLNKNIANSFVDEVKTNKCSFKPLNDDRNQVDDCCNKSTNLISVDKDLTNNLVTNKANGLDTLSDLYHSSSSISDDEFL